eukprot:Skav234976  [mRNA]  locus=scaffold122:96701:100685:+ [translate_table: standard]
MEGHIPSVSEAAPGFLSAAHLRSEEYWRDLLGLDDEHQAPFHCNSAALNKCRAGHELRDILPFSRMIWLVRFLRVLSMIPSLRELTLGIMDALHGLFWVLIFLFIFVYALAVVLTRMVGHQKKSENEDVQEVMDMFSNVGNSMFYLFQLTSQWSLVPLFPLLKASPFICVSFTLFYIYSGWVIVAVMTGTVSFTMISFKERMVQDDESREEELLEGPFGAWMTGMEKRHFVKLVLTDIFEQLDSNGDGD